MCLINLSGYNFFNEKNQFQKLSSLFWEVVKEVRSKHKGRMNSLSPTVIATKDIQLNVYHQPKRNYQFPIFNTKFL